MNEKKKYGLIVPKKKDSVQQKRKLTAFNNSSDDESGDNASKTESIIDWAESSIKNSGNSGQKSMQRKLLREALKEDSTVFQYDDVYDEMKSKKDAQAKAKRNEVSKKPKYINTILQHAEKRKIDLEKRQERKVQKEREAEGDEFADKESFVTSSYLKKLEEISKHDREEALEALREERDDVLKHKNFSKFYSSLYKMKMGETQEPIKTENSEMPPNEASSSAIVSHPVEEEESVCEEIPTTNNRDDDTSSSKNVEIKQEPSDSPDESSEHPDIEASKLTKISSRIKSPKSREREKRDKMKIEQEKFKLLFTKRTVDHKFDEAVQRYFERKAGQSIVA